MATILRASAKIATLGLLKFKIFLNKSYGPIIPVILEMCGYVTKVW